MQAGDAMRMMDESFLHVAALLTCTALDHTGQNPTFSIEVPVVHFLKPLLQWAYKIQLDLAGALVVVVVVHFVVLHHRPWILLPNILNAACMSCCRYVVFCHRVCCNLLCSCPCCLFWVMKYGL